jgi:hypothetical protein
MRAMTQPAMPASLNDNITGVTRLLMASRNMNQTDLAHALNVDKAIITRSFAGKRPAGVGDRRARHGRRRPRSTHPGRPLRQGWS